MITEEVAKKNQQSFIEARKNALKRNEQKSSYQEILEKCTAYFHGDDLAASTWMNKYAMKDKEGNIIEHTPEEMHLRMAKEFARKENDFQQASKLNGNFNSLSKYGQQRAHLDEQKIYELFKDFK